jgi:hypothetical protein
MGEGSPHRKASATLACNRLSGLAADVTDLNACNRSASARDLFAPRSPERSGPSRGHLLCNTIAAEEQTVGNAPWSDNQG